MSEIEKTRFWVISDDGNTCVAPAFSTIEEARDQMYEFISSCWATENDDDCCTLVEGRIIERLEKKVFKKDDNEK